MLAQLGAVEMHMHVDGAGGGDHPFAVADSGGRGDAQARIDPVHDGGVAGFSEADDLAVLDAEIALNHAEHRVDDEHVAQQHVEGAVGAGQAGHGAHAVAQGLAAAMQAFLAIDGVVLLDHGDQRGVAEAHAVAGGGAVHGGIVGAAHTGHVSSPW